MSDRTMAQRISEVIPGIFRIALPLPIPGVGSVNSYVIANGDRHLIVDPGMADPACCAAMEQGIRELGLELERCDFFITHHHLDHFGSVPRFLNGTSRVFISRSEAEFIARIASGAVEADLALFLEMLGFPEKNPSFLVSQFYGEEYRRGRAWPFNYVADGDVLTLGEYPFSCLVASGHSIGHSCLYDTVRRILISGDQITAGIQFLLDRTDPLADHFQSLDRLRNLDAGLVLPGHGSPYPDQKPRIDYLRSHHQGRLDAIHAALGEEGRDAYEVTVAVDGVFPDRDRLNILPPVMRFIHTRHTYAYLRYLEWRGMAGKEHRHGRVLFCRSRQTAPAQPAM